MRIDRGPQRRPPEGNRTMNRCVFYFAYGSNMNPERIAQRIPGARLVGTGTIRGWIVRERLYADIEPKKGGVVDGVVYCITQEELAVLDRYEGYPTTYGSHDIQVKLTDGGRVKAVTYAMTAQARSARDGMRYPEWYRRICSTGARAYGIYDEFKRPAEAAGFRLVGGQ